MIPIPRVLLAPAFISTSFHLATLRELFIMSSETAASAPSAPPSVFSTGARVSTQYGLGEVTGVRWAPDGITAEFYEVKLEYGRAVLTSSCVSAADVTLDELIAAADASRAAGNARYKERDYDTALLNYRLATAAFREETGAFKGVITDAQKRAMRDSIVKSLSNMAMVYIAKGEPSSLAEAIAVAGHVRSPRPHHRRPRSLLSIKASRRAPPPSRRHSRWIRST